MEEFFCSSNFFPKISTCLCQQVKLELHLFGSCPCLPLARKFSVLTLKSSILLQNMSAVIKYFSETYLQEKGARDTSLLTFCKDNLLGLKRSYDPNECSHCKTREGELRRCAKCHVAKYCSKECQSVDWKARHKKHCREITMLEETICRESEADVKMEKKVISDGLVFKAGETRVLRSDMCHKKMCVLDRNTLILRSYFKPRNADILSFYDCTKGLEDRPVVMDQGAALILGQEAVSVGGSMYVAVTLGYPPPPTSGKHWQINFYPHDSNTLKPCYTYKPEAPVGGVGALHFTDGKLLVATDPFPVVEEFNVSMLPIKPTGKVIRANEVWLWIDVLRTLVQDGEKRIVTVQTAVFGNEFFCTSMFFFPERENTGNFPKYSNTLFICRDKCSTSSTYVCMRLRHECVSLLQAENTANLSQINL